MSEAAPEPQEDSVTVSTRKDHRFLARLYHDIEREFDVNALKIEGVHIWPLIRLQLGRSFKEADPIADAGLGATAAETTPQQSEAAGNVPLPRNKTERSKLLKRHAKEARENIESSAARVAHDWKELERAAGPTFVVQTKIEKYYLKKADGFFAPILDPVAEDLARFGRVQRLAIEPLPIACAYEPLRVDLNAYLAVHNWPKLQIPDELERSLSEIEEYSRKAWPDFPLQRQAIYSRLNRMRQRRDFYYEVYSRLKPEFLVVSSFTGWQHALWAAKDLGIPVIDVQHGGQGPIHFPTTHYSALPENGYHLLPDVFWLWGQTNYDFAAKWHPGNAKHRHFPVVGGHRGVARWDKDRQARKLAPADHAFISRFGDKRNVLVTLSYALDPLMPDPFFDAIRKTPQLNWLIRLHPIHRSQAARDQIVSRLESIGCTNFSIDEPTDVQMQTALFVSRVHLTPFSTSVREAMAFGVPSAICHPAGELLFREEIETGLLDYAEKAQSIVDFVTRHAERESTSSGVRREAIELSDKAIGGVVDAARNVKANAPPLCSSLPEPATKTITKTSTSKHGHGTWRYLKKIISRLRAA